MEEPSSEISAKKDVHLKCRTCGREFKGFGGYSQHRCSSSSTPSVVNKVDREEDRLRLQQDLQERVSHGVIRNTNLAKQCSCSCPSLARILIFVGLTCLHLCNGG
mmetsp:Transcript_33594/g.58784  ORF Transcript_33594/g.58784 Transcript_33594/m.58784 type:complete len:105 (-) Transcript_33594:603-917(-)